MATQRCNGCGETTEHGYSVCWNCGTHLDGSAPDKDFIPDNVAAPSASVAKPRELACLRCGATMTAVRRMRLHEGTPMEAFLYRGLDEPYVNREPFDMYACRGCGKVEFFLTQ
jgi:hypothetical protein